MQPRPSPTSPAAKVKQSEVAEVWRQGSLQQPLRTPWGKITFAIIVAALIINGAMLYGVGWFVHRYPQSWVARLAPLTATTTTVIQPTKEVTSTGIPTAVQAVQSTAYGLARNQGDDGIYTAQDVTGFAWPLSSSGWLMTVAGSWPADVKTVALVPPVGQPLTVTSNLPDPATPFIFLKSSELTSKPAAFAPESSVQPGLHVWVVTAETAIPRQLSQWQQPKWASSDVFEGTWSVDAPLTLPVGSAVVDVEGRIVGLLGTESRIWPVSSIESVVHQVVQSGAIVRPTLGLRYIDERQAAITGQPNASGILIGAAEGQTAVVVKGPADKAGLKPGDRLTALDRQPLTSSLQSLIQTYKPSDTISLTVERNDKEIKLEVKLGSTRS